MVNGQSIANKPGTEQHSGGFGERLGALFQIRSAPSFSSCNLKTGTMAVTDIRSDDPVFGVSDPVPREDAYLLCFFVADMHEHQVWEDGRPFPRRTVKAGEFILRDLKRGQAALIDQPHHSMHVYMPRRALDGIADEAGASPIHELVYRPGEPFADTILRNLAACLRLAFEKPEQANLLFLDYILLAMGAQVAATFGDAQRREKPPMGGLAAWQERRAKEVMRAHLGGDISLADVARQCGLSVSQFARAFKTTTGVAPHRWLIQLRVEAAKQHLADPSMRLAEIALCCGFADQSHLTRVFSRYTGITPAAWRRAL